MTPTRPPSKRKIPRPVAAPNAINQDDVGFIFQDLKKTDPRVWQAITSLKAHLAPEPFYAEVMLSGKQTVANDVLDHPCILRLPIDPYGIFTYKSILLQDCTVVCKVPPVFQDYVADVLITRNQRQTFTSIFKSDSKKAIIRVGTYETKLDFGVFGTTELYDDDEFRIDVLQADSAIRDCWIMLRGTADFERDNQQQNIQQSVPG